MDTPPPGFLLPFVSELLGFYAFFEFCNTRGWGLMVYLLSSQRWHWGSNLWSLPGLQIWASFLCVLPIYLSVWGAYTESLLQAERMCGWGMLSAGGPLGQSGGDCRWDILSRWWWACWCSPFVASRICVPLMSPESPICCSLCLFLLPTHIAHNSVLGWGDREMTPFGSVCTAGEAGCPCTLLFPTGSITGWEGLSCS